MFKNTDPRQTEGGQGRGDEHRTNGRRIQKENIVRFGHL